jgi:hypothetical protein
MVPTWVDPATSIVSSEPYEGCGEVMGIQAGADTLNAFARRLSQECGALVVRHVAALGGVPQMMNQRPRRSAFEPQSLAARYRVLT